jgi:hypothetical protein
MEVASRPRLIQSELLDAMFEHHGEAAIDAMLDRFTSGDNRISSRLARTAAALGIRLDRQMKGLLSDPSPKITEAALRFIGSELPIGQRSVVTIQHLLDNPDVIIELPIWLPEEREADPDSFEQYTAGLTELLRSEPVEHRRAAMRVLASHRFSEPWFLDFLRERFDTKGSVPERGQGELSGEYAERIREHLESESRKDRERRTAMHAYLLVAPDLSVALAELKTLMAAYPLEVSASLSAVSGSELPDELVRGLVFALPQTHDEWEFFGKGVIAGRGSIKDRSVGSAAVPHLIDAVESGDERLAMDCVTVLRSLGADAEPAVPALLRLIDVQSDTLDNERILITLHEVARDDPSVDRTLRWFVRRPSSRSGEGVPLDLAHRLAEESPRRPWFQEVLDIASSDEAHPFRSIALVVAMRNADTEPVTPTEDSLLAQVSSTEALTRLREAYGGGVRIDTDEQFREVIRMRENAAAEASGRANASLALSLQPRLETETVSVMLQAARHPATMDVARSFEAGGVDAARTRIGYGLEGKHWDFFGALYVARGLAAVYLRHPEHREMVLEGLQDNPVVLGEFLATGVHAEADDDPRAASFVEIPPSAAPELIDAAMRGLRLKVELSASEPEHLSAVMGIARLPSGTPGRFEALWEFVCFASGPHVYSDWYGPESALKQLCVERPLDPRVTQEIEWLLRDDVPWTSRGLAAAEAAGPEADSVLDRVIELGRAGHRDALRAAAAISPDDPRLAELRDLFAKDEPRTGAGSDHLLRWRLWAHR